MDNSDAFARSIAEQVAYRLAEGIRNGEFLPPSDVLTPAQAAALLHVTEAGLETMRHQGRGPKFYRPSAKLVRYRKSDIDAWLDASTVAPGE